MSQEGNKEVLRTYLQWMRPGAGILCPLAIVLVFCNQEGLLSFSSLLSLGLVDYILYQAEKMSKSQEALTRLTQGIKRDLLLYSSPFTLLWFGLIFYLYQG